MSNTLIVNLSDYPKERVQVYAEHRGGMKWDITINDMDNIWLGDAVYYSKYNYGLQDCGAQFTEVDYRLIEEALGIMVQEESRNNSAVSGE